MDILLKIITCGIPVLFAVTLHEAVHGYVALRYGDDTAKRMGRVSLNPLKHIDPMGTILLPGILLLIQAPVLFGYAKPVPVNFARLKNPRTNGILVAGAGPAMNVLLAFISALLMHLLVFLPTGIAPTVQEMLAISIQLNAVLAIFNMLPILPLDGGRVLLGFLPPSLAMSYSRIEPYGLFIVFGLLLIPLLFGFNLIGWLISHPVSFITKMIAFLAGLS